MIVPTLLPGWTGLADTLLDPVMRLLSGRPSEAPQETHAWHVQPLTPNEVASIDLGLCVVVDGNERSVYTRVGGPLFHIPLLGGWRNYVVLEAKASGHWHIGWLHEELPTAPQFKAVNRLQLTRSRVRMLRGVTGMRTKFFALDATGNQIPLALVGEGKLGDSEFAQVRLL